MIIGPIPPPPAGLDGIVMAPFPGFHPGLASGRADGAQASRRSISNRASLNEG